IVISLFALILLANSPMLIAKGSFVAYRTVFTYSSMAVIAIFWLLWRIWYSLGQTRLKHIPIAIMVSLTVACSVLAFRNVLNSSLNANTELNFVRQKLSEVKDFGRVRDLKVICALRASTFIESKLTYEFKYNTTNYGWVPGIFSAVMSEMGINALDKKIGISVFQIHEVVPIDIATLVIDMNDARIGRRPVGETLIITQFAGSSNEANIRLIFDGSLRRHTRF
ncbi:MAG: hypothetical protein HY805_09550, partial [Nitrospirae bacterium]|nr:hypothetical protein [Nitrospirota bacterium]